jgi:hypothetical protein
MFWGISTGMPLLPVSFGDRRAEPSQHDFQFGHGAAQHRQHGFQIPNRASGPDIDDIGHHAGPGCSALAAGGPLTG